MSLNQLCDMCYKQRHQGLSPAWDTRGRSSFWASGLSGSLFQLFWVAKVIQWFSDTILMGSKTTAKKIILNRRTS